MCVGYELRDNLKVRKMNDNRNIRTKMLQILVSGVGPALLACLKRTDTSATSAPPHLIIFLYMLALIIYKDDDGARAHLYEFMSFMEFAAS